MALERSQLVSHLQMGLNFAEQNWIPVNEQVLGRLRSGLKSGTYQKARELFIADLKQDIALFLFCLKKLAKTSEGGGSPETILQETPFEKFEEILATAAEISPHSLVKASAVQAQVMMSNLSSATVTAALGVSSKISEDLAFSASLLRQFGMTLVAWNFPHVLERAIHSKRQGQSLDSAVSRMLGFSPTMLALSLAQDWGLTPTLQIVLGAEINCDEVTSQTASQLRKLCEIGEAFARIQAPDVYGTNEKSWDQAALEVQKRLGDRQFHKMLLRLKESAASYATLAPELFKLPELKRLKPEREARPATDRDHALNKYEAYLPPAIRDILKEIYKAHDSSNINKASLERIIKEVVPGLGFTRGCVFLTDPETHSLVPRLTIGKAQLKEFQAVNYTVISLTFNPIAAAFRSNTPITSAQESNAVDYIAGTLGQVQKAGVIYLEMSPQLAQSESANPLVYFKAVRQAFNDMLNLY